MRRRRIIIFSMIIILVAGIGTTYWVYQDRVHATVAAKQVHRAAKHRTKSTVMRTPIDWRKSSEKVAYPDVKKYPDLSIRVSLAKQRMYLMDHQRVLYTMYVSTGIPNKSHRTPRGTYHVQAERGKYFYSGNVNEGAYYWVSWLNHGEYLFHSTPVDAQKHFIKSDAADLGVKPSSHGCVHLSVADAKWVYDNIKEGTKVVID